jgi:hypothetical protein
MAPDGANDRSIPDNPTVATEDRDDAHMRHREITALPVVGLYDDFISKLPGGTRPKPQPADCAEPMFCLRVACFEDAFSPCMNAVGS